MRTAIVRTLLAIGLSAAALAPSAASSETLAVSSVGYDVVLAQDATLDGPHYTVRGSLYDGPGSGSVVLLLHGLSYGWWAWDFPAPSPDPNNPNLYSIARSLAARGIDAVAIDELGYGSSDLAPGSGAPVTDVRQLTIPAYANMAHQIVQNLRASYAKVAIAGHSAGAEISTFEAGRYQDVDALAHISMCDVGASPRIVQDAAVNDIEGVSNDYVYFGTTESERTGIMYDLADADPAVVALDNGMANLTPAAEIQSISGQPAREMAPRVTAPVLVVFSDNDAMFPKDTCQPVQPLLYTSSPSVESYSQPLAGHSLMLHLNAGPTVQKLGDWLLASLA